MRKYYYISLVRKDNSILLIVKDHSILWGLQRICRFMHCLESKTARIETQLPKGTVNGSWKKIGCVKLKSKVKVELSENDEQVLDFYITRSKVGHLPPLMTKKGHFISDPIRTANFFADEDACIPLKFIEESKLYKCEVNLVLITTGSNL